MYKTYWTLFTLGLLGMILSFILIVFISVLAIKGLIKKQYFIISTIVLVTAIAFSLHLFIPCIKDYRFISEGSFPEDEAVVVEFTYVKDDPDGNGETQYSKPRFYIESKDEYLVLNVSNVEIGKKYKIRYLPNTRICEILSCIEE